MTFQNCYTRNFTSRQASEIWGAIHSTKIQTGPIGKKRTTSKGGPVFWNLFRLDRTDPLSLDRNFRKFWLNGSRPWYLCQISRQIVLLRILTALVRSLYEIAPRLHAQNVVSEHHFIGPLR